ncbi:helix-turn-helix domain-containing protein [Candidatus Sneabacter namystus]|uniref:Helix-turn-helix domain-containing protein n=1 Tax=Candidatus Sneabacter namystus TaxID=2601646 RepID=A0A5C0UIF3_9RICK|nr:helix-turn-helix transcriptional regulator [Candidatus Sneabacter namystus]QEK39846.1 helix-turn-helix domain-containing protein [Candidatus Sneabacter namystus]
MHQESITAHDLKRAREALSLSIEEVHNAINISVKYLKLLEDEEDGMQKLESLVSPVYAKGYKRIYAQYLGIDTIDANQMFHTHMNSHPQLQSINNKRHDFLKILLNRWCITIMCTLIFLVVFFFTKPS